MTLLQQLIEVVGADAVTADTSACAAYSLNELAPHLLIEPASRDQLAQVLALAFEHGAAVVPAGGASKLALASWGAIARQEHAPRLLIRTTRLNRVQQYEPADLTISVEAGMRMADLNRLLAEQNQILPLDPALPQQASIGGILASGLDGPRRPGYGTARDLLIGIQVVEATGRSSKAGGMVVKNVSGFDMMKLYLGSLGSLALIVGANFKLIPRPRAAATLLCGFEQPEAAWELVERLQAGQLTPSAVEYLAGDLAWLPDGLSRLPVCLAICAEGLPAAVERHLRELRGLSTAAVPPLVLHGLAHDELWARINDLPQLARLAPGELVLRLGCRPAELRLALQQASERALAQDLVLQIQAHALSGVAYLRVQGPLPPLVSWYATLAARWPGLVRLAANVQPAAVSVPRWGAPPQGLAVMRRIKSEFDPRGMLPPGPFDG